MPAESCLRVWNFEDHSVCVPIYHPFIFFIIELSWISNIQFRHMGVRMGNKKLSTYARFRLSVNSLGARVFFLFCMKFDQVLCQRHAARSFRICFQDIGVGMCNKRTWCPLSSLSVNSWCAHTNYLDSWYCFTFHLFLCVIATYFYLIELPTLYLLKMNSYFLVKTV